MRLISYKLISRNFIGDYLLITTSSNTKAIENEYSLKKSKNITLYMYIRRKQFSLINKFRLTYALD